MGNSSVRVFVTGPSGFIGAEVLRDSGMLRRYELIPCVDVAGIRACSGVGKGAVLLHLAGQFAGDRSQLWESNVDLTRKVLDAFRDIGGARVIYVSSGAVYGGCVRDSGSLESDPIRPVTYYGFTKQVSELLLQHHWTEGTFQILRAPNVYGASQSKGVVHSFMKQIRENGSIMIGGDGEQRRDFMHVSDLIRAIILAIDFPGDSDIFNVSSGLTLSINRLADILIGGMPVKRIYVPDTNGLRDLVLNIDRARDRLGFFPEVRDLELKR